MGYIGLDLQESMDRAVIAWLAQKARESVPRGDRAAAESAFCSEMAASREYASYFPWLKTIKEPTP